jgi:hypothetical protein
MKVFLPAIVGHVPDQMVKAVSSFVEFCYCVRRSVIDEATLIEIDTALAQFHHDRSIFLQTGVRTDFNLPRQHSLNHYRKNIQLFGALNGLCSSITESKHIKAVKQPWRRTNRWKALGQMLVINQRNDKLAALLINFASRGMLSDPWSPPHPLPPDPELVAVAIEDDGDLEGERIEGRTKLGKTPGKHSIHLHCRSCILITDMYLSAEMPL